MKNPINRKISGYCGLIAPILVLSMLFIIVFFSPWFSFEMNWISEFGINEYSWLFNTVLFISGILTIIFSLEIIKDNIGGYLVTLAGVALVGIALFPMNWGGAHQYFSGLFFTSMSFALLTIPLVGGELPKNLRVLCLLLAVISITAWMPFVVLGGGTREFVAVITYMIFTTTFGIRMLRGD